MSLSDYEWHSLQLLLKKAGETQQLESALASQGLQMPMMPSQAVGAMTDASKRRLEDASSTGGDFELVAASSADPTDVAEQIAAAHGPYTGPIPVEMVTAPVVGSAPAADEDNADVMHHNVLPYQRSFAPVLGTAAFVNLEVIDAKIPLPPNMKSTYHWGQVKIHMKKYKAANITFEDAVRLCLSGDCEMRKYLKWIRDTYTAQYLKFGATSQAPDLAGYMARVQLVIPEVYTPLIRGDLTEALDGMKVGSWMAYGR